MVGREIRTIRLLMQIIPYSMTDLMTLISIDIVGIVRKLPPEPES